MDPTTCDKCSGRGHITIYRDGPNCNCGGGPIHFDTCRDPISLRSSVDCNKCSGTGKIKIVK